MSALSTATKSSFHNECADFISTMDDTAFCLEMKTFMDVYGMCSLEYKIPEVRHAEVPLDSRLMKLEESEKIKEPYVISISDPDVTQKLSFRFDLAVMQKGGLNNINLLCLFALT